MAERDSKGRIKKGHSLNPAGKPKGTQAKLTRDMREMLHSAMSRAGELVKSEIPALDGVDGGEAYLTFQAIKNPSVFAALLGKTMPAKVDVDISVMNGEMVQLMEERRQQLAELREIPAKLDKEFQK